VLGKVVEGMIISVLVAKLGNVLCLVSLVLLSGSPY
jgi:hypothetical protein